MDIHWIEAAANYIRVHTASEAYMVRGTIGEIANKLDPSKFIRIHRSIIVNVDNIKELQPCNSGEYMVVLRNGKELPGSRGFRPELERVVRDFGVS
jgi:two-component system LytT family response regulator